MNRRTFLQWVGAAVAGLGGLVTAKKVAAEPAVQIQRPEPEYGVVLIRADTEGSTPLAREVVFMPEGNVYTLKPSGKWGVAIANNGGLLRHGSFYRARRFTDQQRHYYFVGGV